MRYLTKSATTAELIITDGSVPICKDNEVLIDVAASGVNRADLLQLAGHYPPPKGASDIIGLEVAGTVVKAPVNCHFKIGDRVMALLAGGGYAQFVAVDAGSVLPMPQGLSFEQGAAIPEAFITAYQALFDIAGLNQRTNCDRAVRVLIHAGASGVGSAAIQLALAVGCEVFTTASSDEKLDALQAFGPVTGINYHQQCFAQEIARATDGAGVDIIIDFVAGDYLGRNVEAIALDGTIVTLAMLGGRFGQQLDFGRLLLKRVTLTASTLRNRSDAYKSSLIANFEQQFLANFGEGKLVPVIDSTYCYREVNQALCHIANNRNVGKLILHSFSD